MSSDLPPTSVRATDRPTDRFADACAVAVATLMTLCVSGYQFGQGNHTVYLLEALRLNDPRLFRHDWFVSSTLQYHAIFSGLTAALMRLKIVEPAFLAGYVALAILWQVAWFLIARRFGASRLTYLASVLFYYISAAGISLGVYQFLQDSCFLPANVAAIAMLWGFYFWIIGRRASAGLCLGIAALFHVNFAVVGVGAWVALIGWEMVFERRLQHRKAIAIGSLLLFAPSAFNILNALKTKLREGGAIPLDQFVSLYIHFRHTHHFDPLAWPIALWVAFLWPIPFAVVLLRLRNRHDADERDRQVLKQTERIFLLLLALQIIAFVFAGVWFVSESLVQMALWRFSIYLKMFSCIGAAFTIFQCRRLSANQRSIVLLLIPTTVAIGIVAMIRMDGRVHSQTFDVAIGAIRAHRDAVILFVALTFMPAIVAMLHHRTSPKIFSIGGIIGCIAIAVIGWNRWLGLGMTPEQVDGDYLATCHWARDATPIDAIFLVSPAETAFRLEAQRAIIVNLKHVPQLAGEIVEWKKRLCDVLGTDQLDAFPRDYVKLLTAIDSQYESRSPEALINVAHQYDVRYVVVDHELGQSHRAQLVYSSPGHRYFVYDIARS